VPSMLERASDGPRAEPAGREAERVDRGAEAMVLKESCRNVE